MVDSNRQLKDNQQSATAPNSGWLHYPVHYCEMSPHVDQRIGSDTTVALLQTDTRVYNMVFNDAAPRTEVIDCTAKC
jgi:hypothetical protein